MFWDARDKLLVADAVVLYTDKVVIPQKLRSRFIANLHRPTKAQVVCVQERDQPSTGQESATISKEYEMSVGVATEMPHLKPNYFQLFQESQKPQR